MRKLLALLTVAVSLSACAYPVTRVEQSSERPSLAVSGLAPDSEAVITVDGVSYGRAVLYDGSDYVLTLDSGVHAVEVRDGNRVLFSEKIFLATGSSKTIAVQ